MADSIQGYRPGTERTPSKEYSVAHLQEKPPAVHARKELYKAVWRAEDLFKDGEGKPVPCVHNPEFYTGDNLPTDREAQSACSTCPPDVFEKCEFYRQVAHPAWGVWSGEVRGRALQEAMRDDEEDA